jgi:hypothetical protein
MSAGRDRRSHPEITLTLSAGGEAYVALRARHAADPPEIRESVVLSSHEAVDSIPALDDLVLDFDYYGRLAGIRVTGSAHSVLAPSLLDQAE